MLLEYTGEYEKFFRLSLISLLSRSEFVEKVCENCKAYWEAAGKYGEAEAKALQEFKATFKYQNLPPGSTILLTCSPAGLVVITPISLSYISNLLFFLCFQDMNFKSGSASGNARLHSAKVIRLLRRLQK